MATELSKDRLTFRLKEGDQKIMAALHQKLGVGAVHIFRLAIRALAAKEKVAVNSVRP